MRSTLDSTQKSLTLSFAAVADARAYLAEIRESQGMLLPLDSELPQYQVLDVTFEIAGDERRAFRAYVVRVTEGGTGAFDTALVVQDWETVDETELLREGATETPPSAAEPEASEPPKEVEEPAQGETRGVAAVHRIRSLNQGQKAILAPKAGRSERQVLLRDNAPQVLQGLLANPRIEAKEILQIAKSTYATGAILQRIGGDTRWGKNKEVLAALVRNPKSPTLMVTRMVDKLRTSDLRQMAKMSSGLREMVRKAALREYMKRTGQ